MITADSSLNQIIAAINVPGSASTPTSGLPPWMILAPVKPARNVSDLVTTNSSAVIESATANFTQADVGACVIVYTGSAYAGSLNGTIAGKVQPTILSVQDPQHATASSPFIGTGTFTCVIGQDNSAILNAAYAVALRLGGTLLIPPGQFIISELNLFGLEIGTTAVTIKGAGYGQSELVPSPYLVPDGTTSIVFLAENVTWDGLDINWLGVAYPPNLYPTSGGFGVAIGQGARIKDSLFTGWGNSTGTVLCCLSDDLALDGVRVIQNAANALLVHSLNIRAVNCEFISAANYGVIVGDMSWAKFTNCTITGNPAGIGGTPTSGGGRANFFVNCRIEGAAYCVETGAALPPSTYIWDANFLGCVFSGDQGGYGTSPAPLNCLNIVAGTTVAASSCMFMPGSAGKSVVSAGTFIDGGGNQGL